MSYFKDMMFWLIDELELITGLDNKIISFSFTISVFTSFSNIFTCLVFNKLEKNETKVINSQQKTGCYG